MRKLLYISLIALATSGCNHLDAPDKDIDQAFQEDPSGYFWKNSTNMYRYAVTSANAAVGDTESIQITAGSGSLSAITLKGGVGDPSSAFTAVLQTGSVTLDGLSALSFLSVDPGTFFTRDSTPTTKVSLKVTAIMESRDEIYAATDNGFYNYQPGTGLQPISKELPSGITVLCETHPMGPGPALFYAIDKDSGAVYASKDKGQTWTSVESAGGPIVAVSADNDLVISLGTTIKRLRPGTLRWVVDNNVSLPPGNRIISIEARGFEFYGTDQGVLMVSGQPVDDLQAGGMSMAITSLVLSERKNDLYVGSDFGIFVQDLGWSATPVMGRVVCMKGNDRKVFAATASGAIWDVDTNINNKRGLKIGSNISGQITDIAANHSGVFVLTNAGLFVYSPAGWQQLPETAPSAPTWQPGSFTLLSSGKQWIAGTLVRPRDGKIYTYRAYASVVSKVVLDRHEYSDVAIIRYEPDFVDAPSYTIYFQRGVGPLRLERTEAEVTSVTQMVQ
jgi:hypothetical protein